MVVRFLAKRTAVLALAAAAAAFVLDGFQPALPVGILLGSFLAVYKTRLTSLSLAGAGGGPAVGRALLPFVSQVATCALLAVCALVDVRLFAGLAAGLLLVPLFICANAATEKLGLTHNAWGEPAPESPAERGDG